MIEMPTYEFKGHKVRFAGTQKMSELVLKDVCDVLGLSNPSDAIADFRASERGIATVYTLGGPQQVLTVTEPGLYRLIMKSRKPEAEAFQAWVFHEVLPSIREHGCYPPPAPLTVAELLKAAALRDLQKVEILIEHDKQIKEVKAEVGEVKSDVVEVKSQLTGVVSDLHSIKTRHQNFDKKLTYIRTPQTEAPTVTTRIAVLELIADFCGKGDGDYQAVWRRLYSALNYRCHVNIRAKTNNWNSRPENARNQKNKLDMVEELGLMEDLYAIAYDIFIDKDAPEPLVSVEPVDTAGDQPQIPLTH